MGMDTIEEEIKARKRINWVTSLIIWSREEILLATPG